MTEDNLLGTTSDHPLFTSAAGDPTSPLEARDEAEAEDGQEMDRMLARLISDASTEEATLERPIATIDPYTGRRRFKTSDRQCDGQRVGLLWRVLHRWIGVALLAAAAAIILCSQRDVYCWFAVAALGGWAAFHQHHSLRHVGARVELHRGTSFHADVDFTSGLMATTIVQRSLCCWECPSCGGFRLFEPGVFVCGALVYEIQPAGEQWDAVQLWERNGTEMRSAWSLRFVATAKARELVA